MFENVIKNMFSESDASSEDEFDEDDHEEHKHAAMARCLHPKKICKLPPDE